MPKTKEFPIVDDPTKDDPEEPEEEPKDDPNEPEPEPEEKPEPEPEPKKEDDEKESNEVKKLRLQMEKYKAENKKAIDELGSFKKKMKDLFAPEESKKNKNQEFQELVLKKLQTIEERQEKRDAEDFMSSFAHNLGIKSKEGQDFLEFKVMKAQNDKGEDLTEKELLAIGQEVKKSFGNKKDTNPTGFSDSKKPSGAGLDPSGLTVEKFKTMSIMDRNELFKSNPDLYDQLADQDMREDKLGWGSEGSSNFLR